ncbi:MAG: hypothetical protein IJ539_01275 [Prevotella sp.]|nr:hypothetical protein [Prevotella sp.]MBQ9533633.1 hypothetical protein [Prevotella sp.]
MKKNYKAPMMTVVNLRLQHHILVASENLSGARSVSEGTAGARGDNGGWEDED